MNWSIFATVFFLIFLAELGDKTQLAVISSTAATKKPLEVFLAASLAMALVTFLGVVGGNVLLRILPGFIFKKVGAILFLIMAVLLWFNQI